MKTSLKNLSGRRNRFRDGLRLGLWIAMTCITGSFAATSFVDPLPGLTVTDTVADQQGNTYVLCSLGANQTVLLKYDGSGAPANWAGDGALNRTNNNLTPIALCLGPGNTNLYVVGNQGVVSVDADSGATLSSLSLPSAVLPQGISCSPTNVFLSGVYNSSASSTVFGRTADPRGSQAGILIKLDLALSSTAQALTTFGGSSGGTTAESVAIDETGAVYVGGHMAAGSLALDGTVAGNGGWNVDVVYSSGGIGDIATALAVINGTSATKTNSGSFDKINFGSGSDGGFGNDYPFPGGGGTHFVLHATGEIWISSAGSYDFFSTTDDGTQVKVDGQVVVSFPGLRGAGTSSGTVSLSRGLHSVDYVMFQNEGAASAELLFRPTGNPYVYWLVPTNLRDTQNKAYVAKFSGDFSSLLSAYLTDSEQIGSGGSFHELRYSKGWIYAIGFWRGLAVNPAIGLPDNSVNNSSDIDVVRLDTDLKLKGRATVKGNADNEGYSIASDEAGNVYITGSYGPGSVDFVGNGDRNPADSSQDRNFESLSSAKASRFVAKLTSGMNFSWVNQPSQTAPDFGSAVTKVRWNPVLQRLIWAGSVINGTLTLGQPDSLVQVTGPKGFFSVLDPTGDFTEEVLLTVVSNFGQSRSDVLPFGGPLDPPDTGYPTSTNQRPVIKGIQITTSVPQHIYFVGGLRTNSNDFADTRITCTGYSVDDNVVTGSASSYRFIISQDTRVTFLWERDFALDINSDLQATRGDGDPVHNLQGLPGLQSLASGNPDPTVQKHWVAENETVIANIDSEVLDFSLPGLPVKYLVTGYNASGPPDTRANGDPFYPFSGSEVRRQIPQFVMTAPASIVYEWKLKIGVQVNTTGPTSSGLPLVKVIRDPGQTGSGAPTQSDGVGVGTFYYDEHTSLQIGTIQNKGTSQLQGWFNGDGTIFPATGLLADLTSSFTVTLNAIPTTYVSQQVLNLVRPGRVMWNYGDRIFEETVTIGSSVTFNTVNDPTVKAMLRMDLPPDRVDVSDGPSGSVGGDMAIWDPVGKKYYPVRPGTVLSYWLTSGDPSERVIIRLFFKYPDAPHYRHIANTPPVNLDPGANDLVSFNSLKYAETAAGASVDSAGRFSATGKGKAVLLFNETSSAGRGGASQTLRVRVVETKHWDDQLPATQPAIIGQKITSGFDTAGLDSGYTMFSNARYNPSIYKRDLVQGPIIPVNLNPSAGPNDQLVVVWYENRDKILWPYAAVRYEPQWPTPDTGLNRIVIASRYGSESVAQNGTDQIVSPAETIGTNQIPAEITFNPARFQQLKIYNQPDRTSTGYNPNEEHGVLAPSLRSAAVSPQPMAVYALRDGDLNQTSHDDRYTSDPYVLVQFYDALEQEFKMKVYSIQREASNLNAGDLSYTYSFQQEMLAGEPVIPFYPLVSVIGATPCAGTYGRDGQPSVQICFWKDHKGTAWAVSGDSFFNVFFYYPLTPDFWWPAADNKQPGDCVAWLPATAGFSKTSFDDLLGHTIDYRRNDQTPAAQGVLYTTTWPQDVPILKVGETLTFPGGEYHQDNPTTTITTDTGGIETKDTPGLPGVVGFAAGQIVFDTLNPVMDDQLAFDHYTAQIYPGLEQRTVDLATTDFPDLLLPANNRTKVSNGKYVFVELPSSLQKRIFYDPIRGKLGIQGFLNEKGIGDPTLTASPPAVYALEPNILTPSEKAILDGTGQGSPYADLVGSKFAQQMDALYDLSRNPNGLDQNGDGVDQAYRVGLEQKIVRNPSTGLAIAVTNSGIVSPLRDATKASPLLALGPGLAVTANAAFLRPSNTVTVSYVTLAENNSDSLGGSPVVLHIIKVDKRQRYRGAIKTILSDNVFDENIILRSTGDFGGNADELVFEWWYRPEDGTDALPPDRQPSPNPWKLFADPSGRQGQGYYQLVLKGNPSAPEALIGDSLFYLRYRHKDELTQGVNWEVPQSNQATGGEQHCVLNDCRPGIPYQWAGAGNSSPQDLDGDGVPDFQPQLAEGWIKRVLDRVNVYEARINDFSADNPATYSSMIGELGARYEGPVALNPDKNVIENVGLIALYQTILNRGRSLSIDLSTPVSTPSIANALELASTRLADFYLLLGNEAYADALNPTIGYGSDSVEYGSLAPTVFAFQNQVSSLLEEELALLRGQDAFKGAPVYNRLFWNFTHAEGEAAYAMKYDITDVNKDGFIDVNDAMILYPQGHGDAWGHYLTAAKLQYDLLRSPYFNWVSRSEFLNSQDIVIPVDYLDERKFAQIAAAKAKVGAEIVNMTYRQKYVADPAGQWQGYSDTDKNRAWGVEEWARRAGQGAFFDWVTANALLPAVHPNTNYTGIQKVDRTTVQDIAVVSANLVAVQTTMDQVNNGNNPLGLPKDALTFDLDPTFLEVGSTAQIGTRAVQGLLHFDQIFERALQALKNALTAFNNANQINNMIRQIANSQNEFQNSVFEQDLSYRNQLIEIFGSPYDGTIGSGKAFPAGYQGPDTTLYMYVAVNTINDNTAPKPPAAYIDSYAAEVQGGANEHFISGTGVIPGFDNSWVNRYGLSFQFPSNIVNSLNYSDFTDPNVNSFVDPTMQTNLNLPILAKGYTYVAPTEWGKRSSPGELQQIITQMIQSQAELNSAIYDWSAASGQYIIDLQTVNAKYDNNKTIQDLMKGQIAADSISGGIGIALGVLKRTFDSIDQTVNESAEAFAEMDPRNLPTVGLADSPGDILAPVRGAVEEIGVSASAALKGATLSWDTAIDANNLAKDIADAVIALQQDSAERNFDMIQTLQALNFNASNESAARIKVFQQVEALTELSDQYRAKLAEGNRLIAERTAFNKRVAAQAQINRYQDMTFRVSRNAALEKYRSAFDLAARYSYLAATAYDYDVNLAKTDAGSPVDILADLVRQRTLGLLTDDGQPAVGGGGLAEDLAVLMANYNNLKPRMGLNNPQIENLTFSLRNEAFRISNDPTNDPTWTQMLNSPSVYKSDLWQVPEFRQYCRPFSSVTNGPQPGLAITFSTQIRPNKNFFGWPLAGMDNSYDPSVYATKVNSVGVWFSFYDTVNLPQTPRVYLIPVGQDIMAIPNDPDLAVRVWNVQDSIIPVPYPSISANLLDPTWKPLTDSLNGTLGENKRFSSFLAFGFDHDQLSTDEASGIVYNARLVGRSTWNTKWMLIIPGATLNSDPSTGLNLFINSVKDIKLAVNSYGFSGN